MTDLKESLRMAGCHIYPFKGANHSDEFVAMLDNHACLCRFFKDGVKVKFWESHHAPMVTAIENNIKQHLCGDNYQRINIDPNSIDTCTPSMAIDEVAA